ncbi:hypothetical protein BKA80DRAFT_256828 [Phyllosticta citrichinensis]
MNLRLFTRKLSSAATVTHWEHSRAAAVAHRDHSSPIADAGREWSTRPPSRDLPQHRKLRSADPAHHRHSCSPPRDLQHPCPNTFPLNHKRKLAIMDQATNSRRAYKDLHRSNERDAHAARDKSPKAAAQQDISFHTRGLKESPNVFNIHFSTLEG